MKRLSITIISIIIALIILLIPVYFIGYKGYKNISEAKKIVILTDDDIKILNEELNNKYKKLLNELNDSYNKKIENIKNLYKEKEIELDKEYDKKTNDIKDEYTKKISQLSIKYPRTETIYMGTEGWYERATAKNKEEASLKSEMNSLLTDLSIKKIEDESNLEAEKKKELISLETEHEKEEKELNSQKQNDVISNEKNIYEKNELLKKGRFYIICCSLIDLAIILYIVYLFNNIIRAKNKVQESISGIDVVLKQRNDMIPNLVEIVSNFSKYEGKTLKSITEIRTKLMKSDNIKNTLLLEDELNKTLNNLFAVVENYPELKSNENYLKLQQELVNIENTIAYKRNIFNKSILNYNNKVKLFPSNLIAIICNYKESSYFEISDEDRENVRISL